LGVVDGGIQTRAVMGLYHRAALRLGSGQGRGAESSNKPVLASTVIRLDWLRR